MIMASRQLTLRALLRTQHSQSPARFAASNPAPFARAYRTSPRPSLPYKDDQDRESLKPRPQESTKSGSDSDIASHPDAYNPNKTRPNAEKDGIAKGGGGDPLEASGANQDISKTTDEKNAPKDDKKTRSGGSGGQKHGNVNPNT